MLKNRTELMIQLSYQCNLNCIHCAYGDQRTCLALNMKQIEDFIGRNNPILIKVSGGEPTIAKAYSRCITFAKSTCSNVISFSNGLSQPDVEPHFYWISLYGSEDYHNLITQSNHYWKVIDFIKNHNIEYLNSPVFEEGQIDSLIRESERLKIPLRITQLLNHGSNTDALSYKEQRKIVIDRGLDKSPNWTTCSLGFGKPRCSQKACLKPDGTEVICTYLIRGLKCPYARNLNMKSDNY